MGKATGLFKELGLTQEAAQKLELDRWHDDFSLLEECPMGLSLQPEVALIDDNQTRGYAAQHGANAGGGEPWRSPRGKSNREFVTARRL